MVSQNLLTIEKRPLAIRETPSYCQRNGLLEIQALLDGLNLLLGSLRAALVVGSTLEAGILDLSIEHDLGLST